MKDSDVFSESYRKYVNQCPIGWREYGLPGTNRPIIFVYATNEIETVLLRIESPEVNQGEVPDIQYNYTNAALLEICKKEQKYTVLSLNESQPICLDCKHITSKECEPQLCWNQIVREGCEDCPAKFKCYTEI